MVEVPFPLPAEKNPFADEKFFPCTQRSIELNHSYDAFEMDGLGGVILLKDGSLYIYGEIAVLLQPHVVEVLRGVLK